jgi:hypothetical protein
MVGGVLMGEMLGILAAPLAACLILTGIHCYLGLHVVTRGVIFVDLALAQVAALGSTLALLAGYELASPQAYVAALVFTVIGAALFALARFRDEVVPQEAIIGIVYAVGSAAAILILDRAPHGGEAIRAMLIGSVLFVDWATVVKTAIIYAAVGRQHHRSGLVGTGRPADRRDGGGDVRCGRPPGGRVTRSPCRGDTRPTRHDAVVRWTGGTVPAMIGRHVDEWQAHTWRQAPGANDGCGHEADG